MNLHQFRFVQEASRRNLNLTEAARVLHTSQPGVSKAIIDLEQELGIDIFTRHGKRLKSITEPGRHVLESIAVILREVNNLKRIGEEYTAQDTGTFSIASTHTQARYVLPRPVARLRQAWPKVSIRLHQGNPQQVAQMVLDEQAEIGVATESLADYPDLVTLPCYEWQHMLALPEGHPLARQKRITLEDIAAWPLITYHPSFTGRALIDQAFASDVITTYVQLGLGIGIVAEMATQGSAPENMRGLLTRPLGHLLGSNVARVAFKRGAYLRQFVYHFAELLSDRLDRDLVAKAMQGHVADYEL